MVISMLLEDSNLIVEKCFECMARQPGYTFLSLQVSSVVSIQLLLIMGTMMGGNENTDAAGKMGIRCLTAWECVRMGMIP